MFQDSLNTYVLAKLNLNTQGLTFKGAYIFDIDGGQFVTKTQTVYRIIESGYVPTQIQDWRSTPQPYKRIDLKDYIAPVSIAVKEEELTLALNALEEFRVLLNGASDTIDGLNIAFKINEPTAPSSPISHAGVNWVYLDIIVIASAGNELLYGNSIEFKMAKTGETLVELITSKIDIITSTDNVTSTDDYKVKIKNGKQTQQIVIDVFYEDNVTLMTTLLDWLWQTELNQIFDVSIKYTASITKTGTYRITNATQHIEQGTPIGFNLTLNVA